VGKWTEHHDIKKPELHGRNIEEAEDRHPPFSSNVLGKDREWIFNNKDNPVLNGKI